MPSHLGLGVADTRPDGITHLDVLANDQADQYAKQPAQYFQINKTVADNYIESVELVAAIQSRLATILLSLPARQKDKEESQARSFVRKDIAYHSAFNE